MAGPGDIIKKATDISNVSEEDILRELANRNIKGGTITFNATIPDLETEIASTRDAFAKALDPFQHLEGIRAYAHKFDDLSAQLAKNFGVGKDMVGDISRVVAMSYQDVMKMGGDFTDIAKVQDGITKNFNTNVIASTQNVKDLFAATTVTNVEPDKLIEGFRSVGMSMSHIKDEMQKVVDYSYSIGVNVTEVSKRVVENIGKLNLYNFQGGVDGLTKMAAQSSMLGIDMNKTFTLAEKLLDPQAAIDLSASLQRLGVSSSQLLDPLRAMDLAQNDPAELQNQLVELSKQFVQVGKDGKFEIMPGAKRELREIATQLGMNADDLAKMALNSADFSKKMSEIRMPSFATEEQKTLIANLAQMNKETGKYEISLGLDESGKEIKKSIDDLPSNNKELTEMLERASKEKDKPKMEQLAEQQLTELKRIAIGRSRAQAVGRVEKAAAFGKELTTYERQQTEKVFQPFFKTSEQSEELYKKSYVSAEKPRKSREEDTEIEILDFQEMMKTTLIDYGNQVIDVGKTAYTALSDMTKNLDFSKIPGFEDLKKVLEDIKNGAITPDKITESITKWSSSIMKKSNDFYIDKTGIHNFNENDLIVGGINKNTGEIISNNPKEMVNMDKEKPGKNSIQTSNFDSTPLTEFASKFSETMSSLFSMVSTTKVSEGVKPTLEKPEINSNDLVQSLKGSFSENPKEGFNLIEKYVNEIKDSLNPAKQDNSVQFQDIVKYFNNQKSSETNPEIKIPNLEEMFSLLKEKVIDTNNYDELTKIFTDKSNSKNTENEGGSEKLTVDGLNLTEFTDPVKAMEMFQSKTVELQNQLLKLSETFVQVNKDGSFEIMPNAKEHLNEIAKSIGMTSEEFANMALTNVDFNKKLSELKMPTIVTEEQKSLIASLTELNKSTGKYEISLGLDESGKEIKKSIDELPSNNQELSRYLEKAVSFKEKPTEVIDKISKETTEPKEINVDAPLEKMTTKVEEMMNDSKESGVNLVDTLDKFSKQTIQPKELSVDIPLEKMTTKVEEMMKSSKEPGANLMDILDKFSKQPIGITEVGKETPVDNLTPHVDKLLTQMKESDGNLSSMVNKPTTTEQFKENKDDNSITSLRSHVSDLLNQMKESDKSSLSTLEKITNKDEKKENENLLKDGVMNGVTKLTEVMSNYKKVEGTTPKNINDIKVEPKEDKQLFNEEMLRQFITNLQKVTFKMDSLINLSSPIKSNNSLEKVQTTTTPTTIETNKLAIPNNITSTQTQKHEFGQLEISVKVDIPNRPEISTEQIKNVLETTMRSTEFQQSLVVAVNKGKTDNGITSIGGTSNYGNNLSSFGLNA